MIYMNEQQLIEHLRLQFKRLEEKYDYTVLLNKTGGTSWKICLKGEVSYRCWIRPVTAMRLTDEQEVLRSEIYKLSNALGSEGDDADVFKLIALQSKLIKEVPWIGTNGVWYDRGGGWRTIVSEIHKVLNSASLVEFPPQSFRSLKDRGVK